jgi:hypothetical protein
MQLNHLQSQAIQSLVNESWEHAHQGRYYHLEADLFEHLMQSSHSVNVCHYDDDDIVGYAAGLPVELRSPTGRVFRSAIGSLWSTAPTHRGKLLASKILTNFHNSCVEKGFPAYLCYFKENDISRKIFKRFCDRNGYANVEMEALPIYQYHRSMPVAPVDSDTHIQPININEVSALTALLASKLKHRSELSRVYSDLELSTELSESQGAVQWLGVYQGTELVAAFRIWRIRMGAEQQYNFILQGAFFVTECEDFKTQCMNQLIGYAFENDHLRILCPNPKFLSADIIRKVGLRNTYVKYVPMLVQADSSAQWIDEIELNTGCLVEVF